MPNCLCKRSPNQTDLRVCRPTSLDFRLPSYVQDTTDYLTELSPSDISEETLLVSLDVVSLYTTIPHEDSIEACRKVWNTRETMDPPTKSLVDFLTLVLKYNIFEFNGDHYLQVQGTKMAPSYANIFMGYLKKKQLLMLVPLQPHMWLRFTDDIDIQWRQRST